MTRLNADLVKDFDFLEECRAGLEAIPEHLGRDTYLELHDHLVKTGLESAKFRSLMEGEEPNGFEPEDFAIPLYLDKVYANGWDRYELLGDDGTQAWNQHWADALKRGREHAADFARLTDLAKERGISPTARFTNSYQLASQRLKEEMHDRAYEVLNNIDAQKVSYIMVDHSGDPIKVRSELESVLAGSGVSEADQAYLLSVVDEYDAPGSALTREQANASYGALTQTQPADPSAAVHRVAELDEARVWMEERLSAGFAAKGELLVDPEYTGASREEQAEMMASLDRVLSHQEEQSISADNRGTVPEAVLQAERRGLRGKDLLNDLRSEAFTIAQGQGYPDPESFIASRPATSAPETVSPPVQTWPAAQTLHTEMMQTGPSIAM